MSPTILLVDSDPDVVLGDFPMGVPGRSPFTDHAREHGAPEPLIVSFTGRVLPEDIEAAKAASAAVIFKPADPLEVLAEVERLLEER